VIRRTLLLQQIAFCQSPGALVIRISFPESDCAAQVERLLRRHGQWVPCPQKLLLWSRFSTCKRKLDQIPIVIEKKEFVPSPLHGTPGPNGL
jgi:hypothetical protein